MDGVLKTSRALTLLLLVVMVVIGSRAEEPTGAGPRPAHVDNDGLIRAAMEATRAFLEEDGEAAVEALTLLEAAGRRLSEEDKARFGSQVVAFDKAFHQTLNDSRDYAAAGNIEKGFDQFVWVQRGCRICHSHARRAGVMKPRDSGP